MGRAALRRLAEAVAPGVDPRARPMGLPRPSRRPGRLRPGLTCSGKDPVSFAPRSLLPGGHGHQRQAASRGPGLPHPVPDPKG